MLFDLRIPKMTFLRSQIADGWMHKFDNIVKKDASLKVHG